MKCLGEVLFRCPFCGGEANAGADAPDAPSKFIHILEEEEGFFLSPEWRDTLPSPRDSWERDERKGRGRKGVWREGRDETENDRSYVVERTGK